MRKADVYLAHRTNQAKEKIFSFFRSPFFLDHAVQIMTFLSIVLVLSCWVVAFLRFQPSEFQVPLRYDNFLGVTKIGEWYLLYRLPAIALICFLLNLYLGDLIFQKDKMISYIFCGTSLMVSALSLIVIINFGIFIK